MRILSELENLEEKEDLAVELQREQLPLVMWGAGELAGEVNEYLKKNDILLADVFVDDEYYSEGLTFEGKSVISYSMLLKKYKKTNLIMGSSNYEKINELESRICFEKVFCLFSVNYGIYEKTPLSEIKENIIDFETVYSLLSDEKSREVLLTFLQTRVSGNNLYIVNQHEKESNFFNNEIFKIDQNEVYLEVGAYDGDTIRMFLKENRGLYKYIYALEPDDENRKKLQNYIEDNDIKNIAISNKGAWNKKGKLNFSAVSEQISSVIVDDNENIENVGIEVDRLDNLFEYKDKVTIIKINYLEGVKEALEGAESILKRDKPKLAITVGFDCRNIRYIPMIIKKINPEYKVYLRFNRGMISSLTCFGKV